MPEGHGEPTLTSIQSPGGHVILIDNRIGLDPADEILGTLARRGTDEGYTVLSDFMTDEPPDKRTPKLFICTLLRPGIHISHAATINMMATLAAAHAIERNSELTISIRWPSELYTERRRLGEVVVQSTLLPSGYPDFLVLRTEIEMPPMLFPTRLSDVVTRVFANRKVNTADHIAHNMLREFFGMYEELEKTAPAALEDYKQRSNLIGKMVRVRIDGRVRFARAVAIDERGYLVVTLRKGQRHTLTMRSQLL